MAEAASPPARTPAERAALLQRHLPFLLHGALEVHFADDAAEWTRAPTNELHRHDGTVLRVAEGLSLDELGPTYRDGVPAEPSDYIAAGRRDYDKQYGALRSADPSPRCENPPATIVVTVNCSDDRAPPRALRVSVADLLGGRLETRVAIDRRKHYDVRVASVDADDRPSWAHILPVRAAGPPAQPGAPGGERGGTRGAAPPPPPPDFTRERRRGARRASRPAAPRRRSARSPARGR